MLGLKLVREKELEKLREPVPEKKRIMIVNVDCTECATSEIEKQHLLNAEAAMIQQLQKLGRLGEFDLIVINKMFEVSIPV